MDKGCIVADGSPRDILIHDICQDIGVGVPKATLVYKRLKEHGIKLSQVPLSGDELAEYVKEVAFQ